jgi:hypothetical protein
MLANLAAIEQLFSAQPQIDPPAINAQERALIDNTQVLLKSEWRRVKRGEWLYLVAQVAAVVVLTLGLFVWAASGITSGPETIATDEAIHNAPAATEQRSPTAPVVTPPPKH